MAKRSHIIFLQRKYNEFMNVPKKGRLIAEDFWIFEKGTTVERINNFFNKELSGC